MIPVSTFSINTARWDFHSGCPTEAPPRQHFSPQSAPPAFVCLTPQPSSLIQPARDACFCCADSAPSATRPQTSKKTKTTRPLIILSSFCLHHTYQKFRDSETFTTNADNC